jgi:hypothetical protein
MTSMVQLDKPHLSEIEITEKAIDFLLDGQSIAKCRSFIAREAEVR